MVRSEYRCRKLAWQHQTPIPSPYAEKKKVIYKIPKLSQRTTAGMIYNNIYPSVRIAGFSSILNPGNIKNSRMVCKWAERSAFTIVAFPSSPSDGLFDLIRHSRLATNSERERSLEKASTKNYKKGSVKVERAG